MTDPRFNEPRLEDPVVRRDDRTGTGMWGWIAGVAVLALIAFVLIAGWGGNTNTASNNPAATPGSSSSAPATTGSGANAPRQTTPAPATPAPATPSPNAPASR